ncbi:Hpt domain-containing protein [Kordiimonas laminariae]|uniref:Hpt domain-containing protein n=1 Tax=Kordiimonas laminariae TaxID=2917717 RepID=UPI001FF42E22|nr:Hpt domain-containing protein [Kordiimonas laminariae]MCK0069564.1 Hpt domain-containing protein [Kordiimonas laminariae]
MSGLENDLLEELKNEAIDTVEDRLQNIHDALKGILDGTLEGRQALATIRLEAHSLKSVASSFEMKALKVMCHRFEDYFFNLTELTESNVSDIQFFADRMAECLEAFIAGKEYDVSKMVRQLPNKGGFEVGDIIVSEIEVMLVMAPGTATKIVTRELLECGYRMVNVATTMDAIQLIPSMKPDAVIISRHMPELTGVDLAAALKAMPTTKNIPVALLATDDGKLTGLPKSVPVLRKGSNFADDVADVFVQLGIL